MEFYFLSSAAFELKDVKESLMVRKPLLNFDATEFHKLHLIMMMLKCLVAGYGARNIVPRKMTVAVTITFLVFKLLCPSPVMGYALVHLLIHLLVVLAPLHPRINKPPFILHSMVWQVSSLNFGLKVFLDIYVITTVLCYIWQMFREEYEKFCALACYLYCLDYWTDFVVGNDRVGMYHAMFTVYLPVILLFASFSPVQRKRRPAFFPIVFLTLVCLSLKLMKVLLVNGRDEINLGNFPESILWYHRTVLPM